MDGQAPLPRSLLKTHPGLFKDHALLALLNKCILEASWKARTVTVKTGRGLTQVALKKGQFIFGRNEWAAALGMNGSSTGRRLCRLGTMGFVRIQPDTHFSIVTLRIPCCFGDSAVESGQASGQATGRQRAGNGQATGTTEEGKKERSEEGKRTLSPPAPREKSRFEKPSPAEVEDYGREQGFFLDGNAFCDHYDANGWKVGGKTAMKDWKATVRNWKRMAKKAVDPTSRYDTLRDYGAEP